MEKKKYPLWFVCVFCGIPLLYPLLIWVYAVLSIDYSYFVMALDFWQSLSDEPKFVLMACVGLGVAMLSGCLQIIWFFGAVGICKLKQILHNRKTPR